MEGRYRRCTPPATLLYPAAYLAHQSYETFPRNIQSLSLLKVK